jgi:preprotein translocase subunit SecG
MLFTFLLVIHALIAVSLVTVILMQRSEGGGLGTGGSPSGLMSARGAADFLTRATAILATLFVLSSISLAVLTTVSSGPSRIDTSLSKPSETPATGLPVPGAPLGGPAPAAPVNGSNANPLAGLTTNSTAPASNDSVPLAH